MIGRVLQYLPDGSGYHLVAVACGHAVVTRSVNEAAAE